MYGFLNSMKGNTTGERAIFSTENRIDRQSFLGLDSPEIKTLLVRWDILFLSQLFRIPAVWCSPFLGYIYNINSDGSEGHHNPMLLDGFLPLQYYASNTIVDVVGRLPADIEVVEFRPAKSGGSAAALTESSTDPCGKVGEEAVFQNAASRS